MAFELNVAALKTAEIGLPDSKEPRESIKGIHVFDSNGERFYEATDGYIIVRVRGDVPQNSDPMPDGGITFKFSKGKLPDFKSEFVSVDIVNGYALFLGTPFSIGVEKNEYVQIDRAVPWDAEPAKEFALFQPDLLKRATKALGVKKLPRPKMENARSPALFEKGGVIVVLMPYCC